MVSLVCVAAALPKPVHADWQLRRGANDPHLILQMKQALRRNPHDGKTLARLVDAYQKDPHGVERLASELSEEQSADLVVKARLVLLSSKKTDAKPILRRACPMRDEDTRCWMLLAASEGAPEAIVIYERLRSRALDTATEKKILDELVGLLVPTNDEKQHAALLARLQQLATRQIVLGGDPARRRWTDILQKLDEPALAAAALSPLAEKEHDGPRKAALLLEQARLYELAKRDAEEVKCLDEALRLVTRQSFLYRELTEHVLSSYRRRDELRVLSRIWEQSWPKEKRNFVEWEALGRLYDELGDSAKAETALFAALKADGRSIDVWRRLIQLHDRHAQTDAAIAAYRSLIKVAPGEPRYRLELAERLHQMRGLPTGKQEALKLCNEVSRLTRDPGAHTALADLYTRWGYLDMALAERRLLERLEPQEESHRVALGEILYQKGDKKQAIEIWRSIANQSGKKDAHLGRVAEILAEHDELPLALETFKRARELAPNDVSLMRGQATALERAGQVDLAEQTWTTVYERASAVASADLANLTEARHRLAQLGGSRPPTQRASQYLRRADAADNEQAIVSWVLLAVETTQHLSASDFPLRAISRHLDKIKAPALRADLLIAKATILRNQGRPAEAILALEEASRLEPSRRKDLLARSAELSLQLYRDADAQAFAQRAVEAAPNDPSAYLRLAEVYLRRDEADLAIAAYERAIALDPRQWKIYFELSRLHVAGGAPERAAQLLRQVIRRAPDEQFVLDAARRAIDLEEYLGTLPDLEKELAPMMLANPERREYRALLIDVYERIIRPLSRAEHAGDPKARATLIRLADRAQRPLLDLLIDGDGQQQALAVALLGELGGSGAATPLLKLALSSFDGTRVPRAEKDGAVKAYTLRLDAALAGAQAATAAELPLLERLATSSEKHFRIAGYLGLGRLRDAAPAVRVRAMQRLFAGLDDELPEAAAAACAAFGSASHKPLDGTELQRVLLLLGETTRPEVVRAGCATALALAPLPSLDEPAIAKVLIRHLTDGGDLVARQIAWALLQRRLHTSSAAIDALIDAAISRGDSVRNVALRALQDPGPSTDPPAHLARSAEGVDLRSWLLLQSKGATASGVVVDEWNSTICSRHAAALVRRSPALLSRHEDIVSRSLLALSRCAPMLPRPLPASLVTALADSGRRYPSLIAATDAAILGTPSDFDHWQAAVTGPDWQQRLAATEAASSLPLDTVQSHLVNLLRDPNGYVREGALRSLCAQSAIVPVANLVPLVQDPASAVRLALVALLQKHPEGAALLSRLASDRDNEVRQEASRPRSP